MHSAFIILLMSFFTLLAAGALAAPGTDGYYERALRTQHTASLEELFTLYAQSAQLGNAIAQYNIAMMYSNGEAVNVDYQQAAYWFRQSALQLFAPAQYRLGEMYYFGRGGLQKNLEEAITWFRKAADRGDPDAQMNLAMLLGSGEGLPLDTGQALHWLKQARENGHASAQDYHDVLTASAEGRFTVDTQQAYWDQQKLFWIDRAAAYGVREAEEALTAPVSAEE